MQHKLAFDDIVFGFDSFSVLNDVLSRLIIVVKIRIVSTFFFKDLSRLRLSCLRTLAIKQSCVLILCWNEHILHLLFEICYLSGSEKQVKLIASVCFSLAVMDMILKTVAFFRSVFTVVHSNCLSFPDNIRICFCHHHTYKVHVLLFRCKCHDL